VVSTYIVNKFKQMILKLAVLRAMAWPQGRRPFGVALHSSD